MVVLNYDVIATFQPTYDRNTLTSISLLVQWSYWLLSGALILKVIKLKHAIAYCVQKMNFNKIL